MHLSALLGVEVDVLRFMVVECGANPDIECEATNHNKGKTPLLAAAYGGQVAAAEYLLTYCGVDCVTPRGPTKSTPLVSAAHGANKPNAAGGSVQVAVMLLKRGALHHLDANDAADFESALGAVLLLALKNPAAIGAVSGVFDDIVAAMQRHPNNEKVQAGGALALGHLAASEANLLSLGTTPGLFEVLAAALEKPFEAGVSAENYGLGNAHIGVIIAFVKLVAATENFQRLQSCAAALTVLNRWANDEKINEGVRQRLIWETILKQGDTT